MLGWQSVQSVDYASYSLVSVFSELLHNDITARSKTWQQKLFSRGITKFMQRIIFTVDPAIFELEFPVLGICYGMMTAHLFGGTIRIASTTREYGSAKSMSLTRLQAFQGLAEEKRAS